MSDDQGEIRGARSIQERRAGGMARVLLLAAALSIPAGPWAALPVSAMPQQQAPSDTTEVIPLAPIEVSVLRTPITDRTAPMAVSAIAGDRLHRGRSGFFLEESLQALPGVQVQNRYNPAVGERVAIRGFGARAQFGLRGIRVIVDGIPATLPDGQSSLDHLDIGSLGRVEVIRGPASALFGNAAGGVLSFTTEAPSTNPLDVEVMGVGGSDGLWRSQVTASGTVANTGYLVALSGQTWDGFRTVPPTSARADTLGSTYGASDRIGLNARVTTPVAGGDLSFTANVVDLQAESAGSNTATFRESDFVGREWIPDQTVNDLYLRFRTGKTLRQQQAGVRWAGPLGDFAGDFSAYGVHRTINNPIPFDIIDLSRNGGGLRAQLSSTLGTAFGDLNWYGGVEYDVQNDDRQEIEAQFGTGRPAPDAEPYLDQSEDVRSVGVFVEGALDLPGGAVALAGLRYDNHRFTAKDHVPVTADNPDDSGSRTMDALSPSIGVSVPAGDSFDAFGSISKVFETPTTSELSNRPGAAGGFNPDLEPMTGESYEVGLRGNILEQAAFEVSVYQTNLHDELVPFEVAGAPGVTYFRNSGESRHRGVEATLTLAPGSGLVRGDLTYTHTDARFERYVLDGGTNLKGKRVPGVAPNRLQAVLRLDPDRWWTEITGTYVDDVPVNDANSAPAAPSYLLVDVRAGLEPLLIGDVTFSPWIAVTNVGDRDYLASVAVNAFGGRFYEPGPDRSLQIGMQASWGGGN